MLLLLLALILELALVALLPLLCVLAVIVLVLFLFLGNFLVEVFQFAALRGLLPPLRDRLLLLLLLLVLERILRVVPRLDDIFKSLCAIHQ